MRLNLKIIFISFLLFFSVKAFAGNYVSVFKPQKQLKTLSEFKDHVEKDVLQLRSIMNINTTKDLNKTKTIEIVRDKKIPPPPLKI